MTEEEIATANEKLILSYRHCFGSPAGHVVMADLMRFCRFRAPVRNEIEEGKRQAFLRIMNFMAFEPEQILNLYRSEINA